MNKQFRILYLIIASGFLIFAAINILYLGWIKYLAKNQIWFEEKISKVYYLNSFEKKFDFVFVGSSQTQNHINSKIFKQYGMDIFNLGLAGRKTWDQLYTAKNAIKAANKCIVLSISCRSLFQPLKFPEYLTIDELLFFTFKYPASLKTFKLNYALRSLPINRFKTFIEIYNESIKSTNERTSYLKKEYNYDASSDREILYIRSSKDRYAVIYKNGDGQIFKNDVEPGSRLIPEDLSNKEFNPIMVSFLNYLGGMAAADGKKMIINISPSSAKSYQLFNEKKLREELPNCLVINTQWMNDSCYWADKAHLNFEGTTLYSKLLASALLKL